MKLLFVFLALLCLITIWCYGARPIIKPRPESDYASVLINTKADSILKLSEELLYKVKINVDSDSVEQALAELTYIQLLQGLNNDGAKKTFWVNLYNAWYQILAIV